MTLPPENALPNLSREELIAIFLQMAAEMRRLEAEAERLKNRRPLRTIHGNRRRVIGK